MFDGSIQPLCSDMNKWSNKMKRLVKSNDLINPYAPITGEIMFENQPKEVGFFPEDFTHFTGCQASSSSCSFFNASRPPSIPLARRAMPVLPRPEGRFTEGRAADRATSSMTPQEKAEGSELLEDSAMIHMTHQNQMIANSFNESHQTSHTFSSGTKNMDFPNGTGWYWYRENTSNIIDFLSRTLNCFAEVSATLNCRRIGCSWTGGSHTENEAPVANAGKTRDGLTKQKRPKKRYTYEYH